MQHTSRRSVSASIFPLLALMLSAAIAYAGTFTFTGVTDKNPMTYTAGEKMVFTVQLLEDGKPVSGKKLTWLRRGDDGKTNGGTAVSSADEPLTITTSIDIPGFVHIIVTASDENGKRLMNADKQAPGFDGGAGVALDKIEGWPEPADFDVFWAKQKAKLAAVLVRADMVPSTSDKPEVEVFDVKVDCPGKMPVSGYLCKPKNAAAKSLPARVSFHGYGVSSANKNTWAGVNSIAFDINAHGIINGQSKDYYQNLRDTTLKGYAWNDEENKDPETAYFNGMFFRVLRALEFVKSLPEWDGKTLIVSGGSQGGLQCLIAAGLDPDVSRCDASIPWCCDLGGRNRNRLSGWFMKWTDALGYYDAANHAKRIKCKTYIYAGLGDYTCPPSTEAVLYYNITAPKKLEFQQGRTHGYTMPGGAKYSIKSDDWTD
ncbi:MAG: acetylxylan esterase [Spirochaetes bacterium]|nr:acetylxylan esterase [Spirochaetota bacterium]